MRAWLRVARGDDEGTALIEFIWLGLLLMIPLAYVVISLFQVQRTAFAVSAATRAAGRAWVSAPAGSDRTARATAAAHLAGLDQGVTFDDDALSFSCSHECCPGTGTLHVRLTVSATLPGLAALSRKTATIPVTGKHDEVVDRFAQAQEGVPVNRDDEGSLIPLIAFYFVVAATLILVVADASKYYLARRSLQSAADGAALASAQSVSSQGIYGGAGGKDLRLDGDVCQAVADYGDANDLATRFDDLSMSGYAGDVVGICVAAGADRVTVVARDTVKLPLVSILGVLDQKFGGGVQVTVVARASLRCETC